MTVSNQHAAHAFSIHNERAAHADISSNSFPYFHIFFPCFDPLSSQIPVGFLICCRLPERVAQSSLISP